MATRREANIVYAAGLVQGIVLVTFPAASTVFTDAGGYDLSTTRYGTMFLPQPHVGRKMITGTAQPSATAAGT